MVKRVILAASVVCACSGVADVNTQAPAWQPSAGHTQIPIWPGLPPGARSAGGPEAAGLVPTKFVAGRPWTYVEKVSRPTITVYAPQGPKTDAAIVVFPGGGYQVLAIDLEGTEVCDWLTSTGVTCVLLKYRVPGAGSGLKSGPYPDSPLALEDAQRALGLVRLHAAEWRIDPHKIGVLGFSAGGHLVAAVSTHFERRVYPPVDAADRESARPDFAVALYPGHLFDDRTSALRPDIRVTRDTPPTFLVHAENDDVDTVRNSLVYYGALKNAGVQAELHLYAEGGHAFGLRRTPRPITRWPELVETWLATIGVRSQ
jgi:acetyl esterase/lipase